MPDGTIPDVLAAIAGEGADDGSSPGASLELIGKVAITSRVGSRSVYSYRITDRLADRLGPGHLVQVPFGSRELQGVVLSIDYGDPGTIRLRDIADILDPEPCLTSTQIDLARWMSAYYVCSLGEAIGVMLPGGIDRATEALYTLAEPTPAVAPRIPDRQRMLLARLGERGTLSQQALTASQSGPETLAALQSLVRRGLVSRTYRLGRPAVSDLTETLVVLQPGEPAGRLTSKQKAVIDFLTERGGEAAVGDIRDELGIERDTVLRLAKRRIVLAYPRPVRRDPLAHRHISPNRPPEFTSEQAAVYGPIGAALSRQDGSVFLLHGVTGSGKTEVYLRAVAETLASGRQAIVLVPEIGLTPQTVSRFAGRFPGQVALLHSRLSPGERFDEWQRIRRRESSVAVGPRSAIFSPFANLGLIVVDEEHDASYKQDSAPRYHTREVAERLARSTGAVVVLGSATPDVVSFYRAQQGTYRLLTMSARVGVNRQRHEGAGKSVAIVQPVRNSQPVSTDVREAADTGLPSVQIVDMRLELKAGNRSIFSRALTQAMQSTLGRKEQAILFLNRRGHATFVNCRDCGHVVKCRHCDVPMSYHSQGELLVCHRCDMRLGVPTLCPQCGSWRIRYFGLGTQKVEQELFRLFPRSRVQRYDRDVTTGKFGHEAILDRFAAGQIDILVGTQIVAKGLDFPRVTLVGAISADTSINLPDFRAAERTFSLLTQVAGRAGRAGLPGTVVIQTYIPGHFAIEAAAHHDYHAFYDSEIRFRQDGKYPPYSRLARLIKNDPDESVCRREAHALAEQLERWVAASQESGIEVIGPAPCFINKASDRYYWQILLRGDDVHPILAQVPTGWAIDIDPMNLL